MTDHLPPTSSMKTNKRRRSRKSSQGSESDASEDSQVLLAAAAVIWEQPGDDDEPSKKKRAKKPRSSSPPPPPQPDQPTKWSVHVTQIPYQATQIDLRRHFYTQCCMIDDVRLVLRDGNFTGVAFLDLANQASYDGALKLHKSSLLGRRINVRPVRSREELGSIVERTKAKVSATIQQQKAKQKETKEKRPVKSNEKKRTKDKPISPDRKLSKKERNRKAAIIMQRKRARGK